MIVYLGNADPVEHVLDHDTAAGEGARADSLPSVRRKLSLPKGEKAVATEVHLPDDIKTGEALTLITAPQGVWAAHSDSPAAWVECDAMPGLAAVLAEHFGCEVKAGDAPAPAVKAAKRSRSKPAAPAADSTPEG